MAKFTKGLPPFCLALTSCLILTGCPGSSSTSSTPTPPPPPPVEHRALEVGIAAGTVYDTLAANYKIDSGTGSEDPTPYDMVIFDGNHTTPEALHGNPGPADFLKQGKIVVILNDTEDHLAKGLKGVIWAHARLNDSDTPAVAFFDVPGKNGGAPTEMEVDFPVHLNAEAASGCTVISPESCPVALVPPSASQLAADSADWLAEVQKRFAAGDGGGNIAPPNTSPGQTVFNHDVVLLYKLVVTSSTQDIPNPFDGESWEWCLSSNSDSCRPDQTINFRSTEQATFESDVSVLLEPINNGSSYQHKVILRQYSLVSPHPFPDADWIFPYYMKIAGAVFPEGSTLGFNASTWLRAGPSSQWENAYPMAMTEASPTNANNTETLTTYKSHTESVGVSATGGISDGSPVGEVGASWSDSWTWGHASSVSIKDWRVEQSGDPNVTYAYEAASGTPNTYDNLTDCPYPGALCGLSPGIDNLNDLQSGNMTGETETVWTSSGPIGPVDETLQSSAEFVQGEVYAFVDSYCLIGACIYGNTPSFTYPQNISIDFSNPGLQPPASAPWTLSFSPWPQTVATEAKVTGTLSIPEAADNPGPINLSYVIQPQSALLTLPSVQVCPSNTTSFIPGNNVVNNGSPPLTITIPNGQTSVSFPLTFQTFNANDYDVQVVAWQALGTINGKQVVNPQAAWCLTVPNTTE